MRKNILSIHAHPDDAEILAGGTLALLAGAGHTITIVTMTPGDCGSAVHTREQISAIRKSEAAAAAAMIGARYGCAGFGDLAVFSDDAGRRRVVEVLRWARPDIILTSAPADYMADHEATSALVRDACFGAPVANYETGAPQPAAPLAAIPHLYFMDPVGGVDRENRPVLPDFIVDVAATFETKRAMLAAHESQRAWLLHHHGMDNYLDTMEQWTRKRGEMAGLVFGEGFRQYKGHPYPESPLLQELLGAAVRSR